MSHSSKPLAPWSVYRFNFTMVLSLVHRMTGVALTFLLWGGVLVWSHVIPNPIPPTLMDSILVRVVVWSVVWMLSYHTLNGIRHLVWDRGRFMEPHTLLGSGLLVCLGSLAVAWCVFKYGVCS